MNEGEEDLSGGGSICGLGDTSAGGVLCVGVDVDSELGEGPKNPLSPSPLRRLFVYGPSLAVFAALTRTSWP